MASRYPTIPVVDYCFNPRHIVDEDKDIIVPCGKCAGCLLHKANEWSMRCGMEIEDSPATIFGTLTYSNKYLPKLFQVCTDPYLDTLSSIDSFGNPLHFPCSLQMCYKIIWSSDHPLNIRFNGVEDVLRRDDIILNYPYNSIPITHWDNNNFPCINYASKRDIQLWLKLLRRDLDENLFYKSPRVQERGYFRYFIISEVGPTTLRSHFHFLIFCQSREVASYLLDGSLYKNWQMCDESKFTPYCHLCDSGARGYVTQYLTCVSDLPKVYRENKEIRPFRLASKSPGIGFIGQNKEKIYEDVSRGVIQYSRSVPRLESVSILEYPKNYLVTLFPKCNRFNALDDTRRFLVYSFLYRAVREFGFSYFLLSKRLCEEWKSADFMATCACYRFCRDFVNSPDYYYYLLDTYYYKLEMSHLKSFYGSQEIVDFNKEPQRIFEYYPNLEIILNSPVGFASLDFLRCELLSRFGCITKSGFMTIKQVFIDSKRNYFNEVEDITSNMVKMAKFNEITGVAPTIV